MSARLNSSLLCFAVLLLCLPMSACADPAERKAAGDSDNPLALLRRDWAADPIWYDGQAEIARYDASRAIYGQMRDYTATVMINKERLSEQTQTKSSTDGGTEVFKLHIREDIPTQRYAYHFSTMAYVQVDTLQPRKLDVGSLEDCGASMTRLFVDPDGQVNWSQYSYFPDEGFREGRFAAPPGLTLVDSLLLILRGWRFEDGPEAEQLSQAAADWPMTPDQTFTRWQPVEPASARVTLEGQEQLQTPAGTFETYRLHVTAPGGTDLRLWFSTDADDQNLMIKLAGDIRGVAQRYDLKSVTRDAYWMP